MQRALSNKLKEFESKPRDEQESLHRAFNKGDPEQSGVLDSDGIQVALAEVGLEAKTACEKERVMKMCEEMTIIGADFMIFCLEVVPRARQLLRELRRPSIEQDFDFYDKDKSRTLDKDEVMQLLRRLCTWNLDTEGFEIISKEFDAVFDEVKTSGMDYVELEGFEVLVSSAQEMHLRIMQEREEATQKQLGIPDHVMKEHKDELLFLFETFKREAKAAWAGFEPMASFEDVQRMLADFIFDPHEKDVPQVAMLFQKADPLKLGAIGFPATLRLVRQLRERINQGSGAELRVVFQRFDRDQNGDLCPTEVHAMVNELGLMPSVREDQGILRGLLSRADRDKSGGLDFDEFQVLMQRISERNKALRTCRERRAAAEAGFAEAEIAQLREAFYLMSEDTDGVLGVEGLHQAADITTRRVMSSERFFELLQRCGTDWHGGLDFGQFARFMRTIIDESSSKR